MHPDPPPTARKLGNEYSSSRLAWLTADSCAFITHSMGKNEKELLSFPIDIYFFILTAI